MPRAELPELRQGRVWATVPAVAAASGTVYQKHISKGMIGMELAACLCGLAVTVAGLEKEGRGSHFKEGGAGSGLGKEQCSQGSEQLWERGRRNLVWSGQEERLGIQMWWLKPDLWGSEIGMENCRYFPA